MKLFDLLLHRPRTTTTIPREDHVPAAGMPTIQSIPPRPKPDQHKVALPPIAASVAVEMPARKPRRRGRRGSRVSHDSAVHSTSVAGESSLIDVGAPIDEDEPFAPYSAPLELPAEFRALGIDETGLTAIASLGYTVPTPIQRETIPLLYAGKDVIGIAQTGTGKTVAFGLPLARRIDSHNRNCQALVMVPTRELANQVQEVMEHLGKHYKFAVVGLVGGKRLQNDFIALDEGAQVVVGTPGRVIDHIKRGTLSLGSVKYVVLDEADEMLDIGFARDIDFIMRSVPRDRQSALFSATMPESIWRIVYRFMRNAERVTVEPERRTVEGVVQYYCEVRERDKFYAMRHLYETLDLGRSLIFRRTKIGVDRLTEQLQSCGVSARAIHGDLRQNERDRVMADFRSGKLEFLVATNVAARGLDIPDIQHVINYDVPQNAEEYIHRIGRTARAGKTGSAVTLVGEWELGEWDTIRKEVGEEKLEHLETPAHWD